MDILKRPPAIELRQLHAFRIVAEELHFGRAAARLGISQPPLSQQIKRLEQQLGCQLFERDTRRVQLTPGGTALLSLAGELLSRLAIGLEHLRDMTAGEAGRLVVGFTPTTALGILPAVVRAFRRRYANVTIELLELLPDAMMEALRSQQIDVALMRDPSPADETRSVAMFVEPYVAILPVGHAMADPGVPFRLEALARDPFVLFPRDNASQGLAKILALCAAKGFTPDVVQQVPGWQTAISMVGSGLGVSILPESVSSLHLAGIVYRRIESDIVSTVAMMRRSGDDRPMLRNLFDSGMAAMATNIQKGDRDAGSAENM